MDKVHAKLVAKYNMHMRHTKGKYIYTAGTLFKSVDKEERPDIRVKHRNIGIYGHGCHFSSCD